MQRRDDEILRCWLRAERRSTEAEAPRQAVADAERSLRELLSVLPEARPRPGFADRVMAASGLERLAEVPAQALGWPLRAFACVCLLLTGTTVALLPPLAALLGARISLADAVSALAGALTVAADYLAALVSVGEFLGAVQKVLLLVVTSPPVTLTWLAALAFSTLTLRWLVQLLSPQRTSGYVPAH